MNRVERERLLERYLSGELNSAEESDFFIQVALDKELQQELKAQRIIESALTKDCQSEATEHTSLRERVAMMVSASAVAPIRTAPMAPPVPRRNTQRKRRWALAPLQWIFATGLALSFTVGAVIVLPSGGSGIRDEQQPVHDRLDRIGHSTVQGSIRGMNAAAKIAAVVTPAAAPRMIVTATPRTSTVNARGRTFADRYGASSPRAIEEKSVVTRNAATPTHEEAPSTSSEPAEATPIKVGVKIQVQIPKLSPKQ